MGAEQSLQDQHQDQSDNQQKEDSGDQYKQSKSLEAYANYATKVHVDRQDFHTKEIPSLELSLFRAFNDHKLAEVETKVYPKITKGNKRNFQTHYPSFHNMNHEPLNTEYERVSKYTYGQEIDGFSRFGMLAKKYEGVYSKSKEYREFMGKISSNYFF